jgi:hypothetical protein
MALAAGVQFCNLRIASHGAIDASIHDSPTCPNRDIALRRDGFADVAAGMIATVFDCLEEQFSRSLAQASTRTFLSRAA